MVTNPPPAVAIGGMARVAAKLSELKAGSDNSLVLHAGDAVQGTLYYTLFKGEAEADGAIPFALRR